MRDRQARWNRGRKAAGSTPHSSPAPGRKRRTRRRRVGQSRRPRWCSRSICRRRWRSSGAIRLRSARSPRWRSASFGRPRSSRLGASLEGSRRSRSRDCRSSWLRSCSRSVRSSLICACQASAGAGATSASTSAHDVPPTRRASRRLRIAFTLRILGNARGPGQTRRVNLVTKGIGRGLAHVLRPGRAGIIAA